MAVSSSVALGEDGIVSRGPFVEIGGAEPERYQGRCTSLVLAGGLLCSSVAKSRSIELTQASVFVVGMRWDLELRGLV